MLVVTISFTAHSASDQARRATPCVLRRHNPRVPPDIELTAGAPAAGLRVAGTCTMFAKRCATQQRSGRKPRRSHGCAHAQAFLAAALALAGQAATDISSVTGILDTVSAILAVDVDPAGIAADTAVRAAVRPGAQAGTALEVGYQEASRHQDAVHSPLLQTMWLPRACMQSSTHTPAFAHGRMPTQAGCHTAAAAARRSRGRAGGRRRRAVPGALAARHGGPRPGADRARRAQQRADGRRGARLPRIHRRRGYAAGAPGGRAASGLRRAASLRAALGRWKLLPTKQAAAPCAMLTSGAVLVPC
jgi:hypothetical protein